MRRISVRTAQSCARTAYIRSLNPTAWLGFEKFLVVSKETREVVITDSLNSFGDLTNHYVFTAQLENGVPIVELYNTIEK